MMKINTKIYQQMNRVCSLFLCVMCAWICLVGCSPKESEILWSEVMGETQDVCDIVESDLSVSTATDTGSDLIDSLDEAVITETQSVKDDWDDQPPAIYVHVCGAVMNPSVVKLTIGSRAMDALEAAGGLREDASRDYVNLAAEVTDGQQLFFPTEEEVATMAQLGMNQGALDANSNAANLATGKVNINTADESTLCTLPGIGASKAQAIIAYRQKNGPFATPKDIMKVSGIKTSAYEKIQDKIVVQ